MPDIDYKLLLKKYMEHIAEREGTLFLWDGSTGKLSDEDIAVLEKLEAEIK